MTRALLLFCLFLSVNSQAQQTYLEVYGQVEVDINQANDILQLDDTTFVIAGEWNETGYLARVNYQGLLLDYFFLDNVIPGTLKILDLEQDLSGNIIAVGECEHCAGADTTLRVFAVATEPSLLYITSAIYGGSEPANPQLSQPHITRKGSQLVIAASQGGVGLNITDLRLMGITSNLTQTWSQVYNSCGNCGTDAVQGFATTLNGFAALVVNTTTDSVTLYTVNDTGAVLLKKRIARPSGTSFSGLEYDAGAIYLCGFETISGKKDGRIWRFVETDGSLLSTYQLDVPDIDDEVLMLQIVNDQTLLAIQHRAEPNSFGTYNVSRIYRIHPGTGAVQGFVEIPNPDVLTSMYAYAVVPLSADGVELAAAGRRGSTARSFFFSVNSIESNPGQGILATPPVACGPANIGLTNFVQNATSYSWFLNGALFSSEQYPEPLTINVAGVHEVKLVAQVASANKITSFTVLDLPKIWNECAICDNKPDPYLIIKNISGNILYASGWVESYPPVALPVSFTMDVNQTYRFEVWDKDNIGADDFFGTFTVPGDSPGGTFNVPHPGDPQNPLSINFTTSLQTQSSTWADTVIVYRPTAELVGDSLLVATPNSPAPASFTWQWLLDGIFIPGATQSTWVPTEGGYYSVAMITPECTAISNPVLVTAEFTGIAVQFSHPRCHGEGNGEILLQPIGGVGPYTYLWKPPILQGQNPMGLSPGTYKVTVVDALGQTANSEITLIDPDSLKVSLASQNPLCFGEASGSISVIATGGTGDFTYQWLEPGVQGPNPSGLDTGIYTVIVTDINGCTAMAPASLSYPPPLTVSTSSTPVILPDTLGTATATAQGGTPPYAYRWSDPLEQTTQTALGLSPGIYTVSIADANGCVAVDTVEVDLINATGTPVPYAAVSVFPNPAGEVLFVRGYLPKESHPSLALLNSTGQWVRQWTATELPATLDLSGLANGVYLLRLKTKEGMRTWRVVKH